jgi:DNA-binding NarL/FixJ family response regulator
VSGAHPAAAPTRILIVDDHTVVRTGLVALLESQPDMTVVGEAENGQQALEAFQALEPDITLMDLQMPVLGGLQATIDIRARFPEAAILVLTTYAGDVQATKALKAGARGYLLKTALRTELLSAIRQAMTGRAYVSSEVAQDIAVHAGEDPLTPRETEILEQLASGAANKVSRRDRRPSGDIGLIEAMPRKGMLVKLDSGLCAIRSTTLIFGSLNQASAGLGQSQANRAPPLRQGSEALQLPRRISADGSRSSKGSPGR